MKHVKFNDKRNFLTKIADLSEKASVFVYKYRYLIFILLALGAAGYFEMEDVKLSFDDDAITEIAKLALKRKIGARGLRSIIENVMLDLMYEIPSMKKVSEVRITKEAVEDKEKVIVK